MTSFILFLQNIFATHTAAIKCLVCPDTELCPECFAAGAEFFSHKKGLMDIERALQVSFC